MKLSHYTAEAFEFNPQMTYSQEGGARKPRGLWLSVDGEEGWPEWCRSEDFATDRLVVQTPFTLAERHNVLVLSDVGQLRELARAHPDKRFAERGYGGYVDWGSVATVYDGVVVTPYQWEAVWDLEANWYYGWDCASGCFWNLEAVKELAVNKA